MQPLHPFLHTVSCRQRNAVTVGDQFFETIDVYAQDGEQRISVAVPRQNNPGTRYVHYLREGERYEIFPGVYLTYLSAKKRSEVRLRVEAPLSVRVKPGYPREHPPLPASPTPRAEPTATLH